MNKKNLIKKAAAVAVLTAMVFYLTPFLGFPEVMAASHKITESDVGHYDQYHNGEHQMKYKAKMHKVDGEIAYCVHMEKTSDAGAAKEVSIKKFLPGDELVMACLAQKHIFDMEGYDASEKYMLTQCMVWYIQRDHIGDGGWRQYVSGIDMSVKEQKAFFAELEKKIKGEAPSYEGHGTAWENIDIAGMQEVAVLMAPTLKVGDVAIKKVPASPELVKGNKLYSLEGAQYGIYSDAACTELIHTVTTDRDGNAEKVTLEIGTYYVKEIKASPGYELDEEIYTAEVKFGDDRILTLKEKPSFAPLNLALHKIDKESGQPSPQGAASLAGAEFTVCYYDGFFTKENLPEYGTYPSEAKRKWVVKTVEKEEGGKKTYCADMGDISCKAGGDGYFMENGAAALPLGTISIEETKAPKGYLLEGALLKNVKTGETAGDGIYVTQITQNGNGAGEIAGGNRYEAHDRVARGDLSLRKIDAENEKAMAGVSFKLTSKTTGESHIFTTDENGEYDTSSSFIRHTERTNGEKSGDGIWFGTMPDKTMVPADNAVGALPFDTYELEEIKGENNSDKTMYKDTVVISREKAVIRLNNIENSGIGIQTIARDEKTGTHYSSPEKEVTVIDAVSYNNLKKKQPYRLVGCIMDRETGEAVEREEGVPVTSEKVFVPEVRNGTAEIAFQFDATELKDREIVIYEELYELEEKDDSEEPGTLVAEHKDLEAAEQTISFGEPEEEIPKEDVPVEEKSRPEEPSDILEPSGGPEIVKTGDNNSLMHLVILMILSCAVMITCVRIARKD